MSVTASHAQAVLEDLSPELTASRIQMLVVDTFGRSDSLLSGAGLCSLCGETRVNQGYRFDGLSPNVKWHRENYTKARNFISRILQKVEIRVSQLRRIPILQIYSSRSMKVVSARVIFLRRV